MSIEFVSPFRHSAEVPDPTDAIVTGTVPAQLRWRTCSACQRTDASTLVVLDARTMSLVASAEVPAANPLGFHDSFVRGAS